MEVIIYLFLFTIVFIMVFFEVWIENEKQKFVEEKRKTEEKEITYKNSMVRIYDSLDNKIYVDKDTKVMYWWHEGTEKGGLTAMYNADGTPKLYDGDLSKYE